MANTYLPSAANGRDYYDGDYTQATACSMPVFDSPIAASTKPYVLTQEFVQTQDSFKELLLNTKHGASLTGVWPSNVTYPTFYLVDEGPREHIGAGIVKWTRTYATVPDSFDEFEGYVYNFIGFEGVTGINVTQVTGRDRLIRSIPSRLAHDFFIVSTMASPIVNPSDNILYYSAGDIPFIRAQRYYYPTIANQPESATNIFYEIDGLTDSPPFASATVPTRSTYVGWMTNAQTYGWKSGTVPLIVTPTPKAPPPTQTNPGQIPAEDSRLIRWAGNIWLRTTRYILAR